MRRGAFVAGILCAALLLASASGAAQSHRIRGVLRDLYRQSIAATSTADRTPPADLVTISLDLGAAGSPISPLVYGIATKDPDSVTGLGATSDRWGGNPSSRYNWVVGNACNAADDWGFRNQGCGLQSGGTSASDRYVVRDRALSLTSLVTIPALGWVARSGDSSQRSVDVPAEGGPAINASGAIAGYDPAANRALTSVPSFPRKPGPFLLQPDPGSPAVYQDEWVNHLVARFGTAAQGGVRYYEIDNEPMLWSSTQRDVHPAQLSYDGLASTFAAYSDAIKGVDPSAQVLGPESWGWTDYFYSALDQGTDRYAIHADQAAHGGLPLIPWFLKTERSRDQQRGSRSLDILTVHFYPQGKGVFGDLSDPATDALRLRSTRALWDPSYVDESWIGQPIALLPTLKKWVGQYYPGTPIGITEYNFGGGDSVSAALVEAEALGIFGRDGVALANYWPAPKAGSPAWFGFRMLRNYDGAGGAFGSVALPARSSSGGLVSAFAGRAAGKVTLLLLNKQLDTRQAVTVKFENGAAIGAVKAYQYGGGQLGGILRQPNLTATAGSLRLDLPPGSMTMLEVPAP